MAQSNDDLPFDLSLLEGELQQEEAPDPLDLIDDCDQAEAVPEELLQDALRQLQGSQEEQLQEVVWAWDQIKDSRNFR